MVTPTPPQHTISRQLKQPAPKVRTILSQWQAVSRYGQY